MTEADFITLCENIGKGYEIEDTWREEFVKTALATFKTLTPKQKLKVFEDSKLQ